MVLIKWIWILSVSAIPLLMVRYLRISDIPLTSLFLIIVGIICFSPILKKKIGRIEQAILLVYVFFIIISLIDLTRTLNTSISFAYTLKLATLLLSVKLYSFFMYKFGMGLFLKCLTYSSGITITLLLIRSLVILKAPYFVVDPELITEAGKNQVAFYLALVMPCIFWYLRGWNLSIVSKAIVLMILMIHIFASVYVQSRGLLLSLGVGGIITLIFYSDFRMNIGKSLKFCAVATIPLYFLFSSDIVDLASFWREISGLFSDNTDVQLSDSRTVLLDRSLAYFFGSPFFGIGTNNFIILEELVTHNMYMQFLTENGILGFSMFTYLIVVVFISLRRYQSSHPMYLFCVNLVWSLLIYLLVINGFFNVITTIVLSVIICYENLYTHRKLTLI